MTSTNILVNIIGEFQKKGFQDADKATKGLGKSFDNLGKKLAAAFSVAAVTKFAKASIKAFEEDQKAAVQLTTTIRNMGLAFEDVRLQQFIADLEKQSGVLDDQLRPAMQGLLTTTGSLTKSQELLNLAIEISRGTGADLTSVANDLGRAYVGQTRGLAKYSLGLSQTELRTKSFAELQALLAKQFTGQQAAYLETYSGKVDMVTVSYANLQEIVGEELINSFVRLSGDQGISGATSGMDKLARSVGDVIRGFTELLMVFKQMDMGKYFDYLRQFADNFDVKNPTKFFSTIRQIGQETRLAAEGFGGRGFIGGAAIQQQLKARAKAENDALKRARQLAATQKKTALEAAKREREAQALRRAGTVFDMENIQIVAAMQGRITDEQRLRLTALLAINTKNAEAAEKLSMAVLATNAAAFQMIGVTIKAGDSVDDVIKKILTSQAALALVGMGIANIPKAKNPFEDWKDIIADILSQINKVSSAINSIPKYNPMGANIINPSTTANPRAIDGGTQWNFIRKEHEDAAAAAISDTSTMSPAVVDELTKRQEMARLAANSAFTGLAEFKAKEYGDIIVQVNVQGNVTTETDLVNTITDQLYQNQKTGKGLLFSSTAI